MNNYYLTAMLLFLVACPKPESTDSTAPREADTGETNNIGNTDDTNTDEAGTGKKTQENNSRAFVPASPTPHVIPTSAEATPVPEHEHKKMLNVIFQKEMLNVLLQNISELKAEDTIHKVQILFENNNDSEYLNQVIEILHNYPKSSSNAEAVKLLADSIPKFGELQKGGFLGYFQFKIKPEDQFIQGVLQTISTLATDSKNKGEFTLDKSDLTPLKSALEDCNKKGIQTLTESVYKQHGYLSIERIQNTLSALKLPEAYERIAADFANLIPSRLKIIQENKKVLEEKTLSLARIDAGFDKIKDQCDSFKKKAVKKDVENILNSLINGQYKQAQSIADVFILKGLSASDIAKLIESQLDRIEPTDENKLNQTFKERNLLIAREEFESDLASSSTASEAVKKTIERLETITRENLIDLIEEINTLDSALAVEKARKLIPENGEEAYWNLILKELKILKIYDPRSLLMNKDEGDYQKIKDTAEKLAQSTKDFTNLMENNYLMLSRKAQNLFAQAVLQTISGLAIEKKNQERFLLDKQYSEILETALQECNKDSIDNFIEKAQGEYNYLAAERTYNTLLDPTKMQNLPESYKDIKHKLAEAIPSRLNAAININFKVLNSESFMAKARVGSGFDKIKDQCKKKRKQYILAEQITIETIESLIKSMNDLESESAILKARKLMTQKNEASLALIVTILESLPRNQETPKLLLRSISRFIEKTNQWYGFDRPNEADLFTQAVLQIMSELATDREHKNGFQLNKNAINDLSKCPNYIIERSKIGAPYLIVEKIKNTLSTNEAFKGEYSDFAKKFLKEIPSRDSTLLSRSGTYWKPSDDMMWLLAWKRISEGYSKEVQDLCKQAKEERAKNRT